jgi:hypothetical protein
MRKTIKLVKEVKDLEWRDISCLWTGRFNIVKVSVFQSWYQSKSQQVIIWDTDKLILKFVWNGKQPRRANTILKKNKEN